MSPILPPEEVRETATPHTPPPTPHVPARMTFITLIPVDGILFAYILQYFRYANSCTYTGSRNVALATPHHKVSVNRKVANLVLKRDGVPRGMVLYW